MKKSPTRAIQRTDPRAHVEAWAHAEGRHALDAYLEDVMIQRAQGVDAANDRSARIAMVPGEDGEQRMMIVSSQREVVNDLGQALASGEFKLVGKVARRPDEEVLAQMLSEAPLPHVAPPAALPPAKKSTASTLPEPHAALEAANPFRVEVADEDGMVIATSPGFRLVSHAHRWLATWSEQHGGFPVDATIREHDRPVRLYNRARTALRRVR
jgi:hypothetical protein